MTDRTNEQDTKSVAEELDSGSGTWMRQATEVFLDLIDAWSATDWDTASRLPGWRRREVVAHVHHNAEAMRNLVTWARTGVETPMYASTQARNDDIARSAQLSVSELHGMVHASAAALADEIDAMTPEQLASRVRTHVGGTVTADQILWIRAREVAIHTVDLDAGVGFDDLGQGFLDALVRDVTEFRLRKGQSATLAAWLTGRGVEGQDIGPWM